jgi:hypothetical protein
MSVFLSFNDSEPFEPITEFLYPISPIITSENDTNDIYTYTDKCYLIVKDVEDENILKHLRVKIEAEDRNLGVSFWISLDGENWKKTLDLFNVPNNSVIPIYYKWEVLNNLFLTNTGKHTVKVSIYTVEDQ